MFDGLGKLILAGWIISFILVCPAIYFLFSNNYHALSLIVTAVIFLSPMIYYAVKAPTGFKLTVTGYLSLPVGLFAAVYDTSVFARYFFAALGLIVNYLSLFGIVNFIYLLLRKIIYG